MMNLLENDIGEERHCCSNSITCAEFVDVLLELMLGPSNRDEPKERSEWSVLTNPFFPPSCDGNRGGSSKLPRNLKEAKKNKIY